MKIILSGEPRSGKSTMVKKFFNATKARQGFITEEVLEHGERMGFDIVTASGIRVSLARIATDGPYMVGKYCVDITALESVLQPLFTFAPDDLLFVDEIARMALQSDVFKRLVREYLNSGNSLLGTMATNYADDLTEEILCRDDITLYMITPEDREQVELNIREALA